MRRVFTWAVIAALAVVAAGTVAWVWAACGLRAGVLLALACAAAAGISWGLLTDWPAEHGRRLERRLVAEMTARDRAGMPIRHPECLTRRTSFRFRRHFKRWEADYATEESGQEAEKP